MTDIITADDIYKLNAATFANEAVLALVDNEIVVVPASTAHSDPAARIITTATDVHEYCDGDLNKELATQLAYDLTREHLFQVGGA
jgi:hypothetical protein